MTDNVKRSTASKHYLLDASSSDSESDSDSNFGIYGRKLNQTKKEIKVLHSQTIQIKETNIIVNNVDSSDDNDENKNSKENKSDDSDSDIEQVCTKFKKKEKEASPTPPSPPPPPSSRTAKRKSINKHFEELDYYLKQKKDVSFVDSEVSINENDHEKLITIRVSTKEGIKRWEISKNDTFKKIFEDLAKYENTNMENIVLMLREKLITFTDTPSSIDLQICDIIDCCKVCKPVQERIKIVEKSDDEDLGNNNNSNLITITLQGEEGRKSRVKFLIAKDELFGSILQKYCDKRGLNLNDFIIEFDGDKVESKETPIDLDLEGGEIFDVRRSNKPILQHVNENKENYDFDDEIICV